MIYLFRGISRQDFANTALNLHTFPTHRLAVEAENENTARNHFSKDYLLISCGQINPVHLKKTRVQNHRVQGVIYA
ncbi:hypothetical protein [Necropsobacter massiliensis]|uniref:hypothetical protein n=1 Tax=Necropsobacter massiliensis TaxID=1400001 RepID=UPI0005958998|nr:hypothetical protein [Necropsobacter massiliensis]